MKSYLNLKPMSKKATLPCLRTDVGNMLGLCSLFFSPFLPVSAGIITSEQFLSQVTHRRLPVWLTERACSFTDLETMAFRAVGEVCPAKDRWNRCSCKRVTKPAHYQNRYCMSETCKSLSRLSPGTCAVWPRELVRPTATKYSPCQPRQTEPLLCATLAAIGPWLHCKRSSCSARELKFARFSRSAWEFANSIHEPVAHSGFLILVWSFLISVCAF